MPARPAKPQDQLAYPPRAMRAERAAGYLDMSRAMFLRLVAEGIMPAPVRIRGVTAWDRLELDAAFEDLKVERENMVHKLLQEGKHEQAQVRTPKDR